MQAREKCKANMLDLLSAATHLLAAPIAPEATDTVRSALREERARWRAQVDEATKHLTDHAVQLLFAFDVLVTAGAPGSTWLRTLAHETGPEGDGDSYPDTTLMKVNVQQGSGSAGPTATGGPSGMATSPQIAGPLPGSEPDLSGEPIAQSRSVALSDDGGNNFWINGKLFDMKKPATLGTVEEWTLTNTSAQNHPIWMFHCHITGHEDNGIMGYVNWTRAGSGARW